MGRSHGTQKKIKFLAIPLMGLICSSRCQTKPFTGGDCLPAALTCHGPQRCSARFLRSWDQALHPAPYWTPCSKGVAMRCS